MEKNFLLLRMKCTPCKFVKLIQSLYEAKMKHIGRLGFGRMMDIQCKDTWYD